MLSRIALCSFKAFRDRQTLDLAPITLVYGPNSGGKSSIIQSLMLLRQTFGPNNTTTALVPRGQLVDLGSFKSLLHGHEAARTLEIGVSFLPERIARDAAYGGIGEAGAERVFDLHYRAATSPGSGSRKKDSSVLDQYSVRVQRGEAALLETRLEPDKTRSSTSGGPPRTLYRLADDTAVEGIVRYFRTLDEKRKTPRNLDWDTIFDGLKTAGFAPESGVPAALLSNNDDLDRELRRTRGRVLQGLAWELRNTLWSTSYLGPLRMYPARHYEVTGGPAHSVGIRGEMTPQLLYRRRKSLEPSIRQWFEAFEIPYELQVRELGDQVTGELIALTLKDLRTSVTVGPSDVGFGIGQLLPVLVEGLVAARTTICVEQPEIHLHPRLQAHLADFLTATTKGNRKGTSKGPDNQWLIETHSEALMLRLQRRIREGVLDASDVSVAFVLPGPHGSRILKMELDDDGEFLTEWPGGFFEEDFDELFGTAST